MALVTQPVEQAIGRLSIGVLSRATGIPVETLRTWERRYGFPVPERKPSGHRVYQQGDVTRLRRIAEVVARGHRAGEVVTASDATLAELLDVSPRIVSAMVAPAAAHASDITDLLDSLSQFDAGRLTHLLLSDWARRAPLDFLHSRVIPLIHEVGKAWAGGQLEIRHEHFLSERVGDVLRSVRLPFEERAQGPRIIFASLPGEQHSLGLQMAALVLAVTGCRPVYLGAEVPEDQIACLATELQARAIAISVSTGNASAGMRAQIRQLRRLVPQRISILLGGDGASQVHPKLTVIKNLMELDGWGRQLVGIGQS